MHWGRRGDIDHLILPIPVFNLKKINVSKNYDDKIAIFTVKFTTAVVFFVGKTIFGRNFVVFGLNLAKKDQKSPLGTQNQCRKTLVKF